MCLDVKGLVTVGVGNLIDPVELALQLPFHFRAQPNVAATPAQITAEWQRIKSDSALKAEGYRACEALTQLGLDDTAIDALIASRLTGNEALLKKRTQFRALDSWPADAQPGLLSMAWAMGPGGLPAVLGGVPGDGFCARRGRMCARRTGQPRGRSPQPRQPDAFPERGGGTGAGSDPTVLHYPTVLTPGQST